MLGQPGGLGTFGTEPALGGVADLLDPPFAGMGGDGAAGVENNGAQGITARSGGGGGGSVGRIRINTLVITAIEGIMSPSLESGACTIGLPPEIP